MQKSRQSGFTLIEMSTVLVIIALIVAGILVGQNLIKTAQLRHVMTEESQLETAFTTFHEKYSCMVGDCPNIKTFLTGATNGNGNGILDYSSPEPSIYSEKFGVWDDLQRAGLYPCCSNPMDWTTYQFNGTASAVPGYNIPASQYPGAGWAFVYADPVATQCIASNGLTNNEFPPTTCSTNVLVFNGESGGLHNWWAGGGEMTSEAIPCADIQQLDIKYDDGLPYTGKILLPSANAISGNCHTGAYPNTVYGNITGKSGAIVFGNVNQ